MKTTKEYRYMFPTEEAVSIAELISDITSKVTVENESIYFVISIGRNILNFFMDITLVRYMINLVTDKAQSIKNYFLSTKIVNKQLYKINLNVWYNQ